ncbi:MAG: hypothetical protein HQK51_15765 [Oligoflexia bacterium]|nr:hypothetical protein [Oligoflexia bacterium]
MNIIYEEKVTDLIDPDIFSLIEKHQDTLTNFILESVHQNFYDYISNNITDFDIFLSGAKRAISSLLDSLKNNYISGNKIRTDLLTKVTRHRFTNEDRDVTYEELMLDFPIGFALFDLNLAYHSGIFDGQDMSDIQKEEFTKGLCITTHVFTFFIFILFRHEVFQDITFIRFMKDFINKNIFISYPDPMKEFLFRRLSKFGWSLILNK